MNAQSSTIDRLPPAAQDAPSGSAPAHRRSAALPVGPADWSAWVLERMHDANAGLMQNWPLARAWLSGTVPRAAHAAAAAAVAEPRFADVDPPTSIDRLLHAGMGSLTMGISPPSLALAWTDWALHLAMAPGKWQQMSEKAIRKQVRFANYALRSATDPSYPPCITPLPQDRRFRAPGWQSWPYNLVWQAFLLQQQWWHSATTGVGGVSKHHEQVVSFMVRQLLDMISPVNFPATNPEVLEAVIREQGFNLVRGAQYLGEDWERTQGGKPPVGAEAFLPGRDVAITPGKVVFRNRLVELIQYSPSTPEVFAEPILIVPAWIMKYYILDLSPHNSLVKYLVDRGHTVFMLSWHNPVAADRDLGMDDYLRQGVIAAVQAVRSIVPAGHIHAVGYCLGGTLLSIAAAWLARERDPALASLTLLAAQTDFSEPGELSLFIDHGQLAYLEDIMWDQGYLDTKQMAGAFQLLRSNDMIWSRLVNEYLLGRRAPMSDLMAWNADATRMPYRMHSEYLRRCFLNNDLFEGRYTVDGRPIALGDIRLPFFVVGTEHDHVAPWRSIYQIKLVTHTETTFLLTTGGHNAGIVSPPGGQPRRYRMSCSPAGERYLDPDSWYLANPAVEGSWWEEWASWLAARGGERVAPPEMGLPNADYPPLGPAPGTYIFEQ